MTALHAPARLDLLRTAKIAMLAICASGCASMRDHVIERASVELGCGRGAIAVKQLSAREFMVEGCGHRAGYICESKRHSPWWCRSSDPVFAIPERIAEKAAVWLACPHREIEVHALQPARFEARGCGHAIDYECLSRIDCCAFANPGVRAIAALQTSSVQKPVASPPDKASSQRGTLPIPVLSDTIRSAANKVRACYESTLRQAPLATGVVDVELTIGPDGRVQTAAVPRSSLERPDVESCIVEVVRTLRFPPVNGGGIVMVAFPFVLETETSPHTACR